LLILGIVVVHAVHLELHEEAVRREEHPVEDRGSSLFIGSGGIADGPITSGREEGSGPTIAIRSGLTNEA
jgi:hypothetical protein